MDKPEIRIWELSNVQNCPKMIVFEAESVLDAGDCLFCLLVCLIVIQTLEIIIRILSEVVNRERLCGTSAFYFACFRNFWGRQTSFCPNARMLGCFWMLGWTKTLLFVEEIRAPNSSLIK